MTFGPVLTITRSAIKALAFVAATSVVAILPVYSFGQTEPGPQEPIFPGDVVDVDIVGSFDFDWRGRLDPEGFLAGFNTYGDAIFARCRMPEDVARDIERALSKILREPKAVVTVVDRSNRAVAVVDGAVRSPTRFQIKRPVKLRELIVGTGGITDDAAGRISIFRPKAASCRPDTEEGAPEIAFVSIADLMSGRSDPEIAGGDLVSVERASPVYLIGGIANPRSIPLTGKLTLTQAIASAGGLTKEGRQDDVSIFRRNGSEVNIMRFDLGRIVPGSPEDPVLQSFDIVDIGVKGGLPKRVPPVVNVSSRQGNDQLPLSIIE